MKRRTSKPSALEATARMHQLLVQSVRDYGIFILDTTGHIASWNDGAQRIKGYTASEIIGRHFSTFYPPEDVAAGKPAWELEVAVREGRFEEEGWRVRKDSTRFWASVVITTLIDDTGTHVGFAKVTRDLTERRVAQERAIEDARLLAEIEMSNRAKTEFLAAMSHELRTPLNAIAGYTELLEAGIAGPITAQQREYLNRIRGSQRHLLGIITDLLNYSRIESGQVTYERNAIPLHDVVDTVLPLLELQAAAKGIALDHGPCSADTIAFGDRARAEQIVLNLLSNAVKFTPNDGRVTIGCRRAGERVEVVVQDTGPGIPSDKENAIFEPFVQLGRSLTSPHEGTGLGLAISRDLARAMGGDVTVEGAHGGGAVFSFHLPAAPREGRPA